LPAVSLEACRFLLDVCSGLTGKPYFHSLRDLGRDDLVDLPKDIVDVVHVALGHLFAPLAHSKNIRALASQIMPERSDYYPASRAVAGLGNLLNVVQDIKRES